jgi:hypothetical protein
MISLYRSVVGPARADLALYQILQVVLLGTTMEPSQPVLLNGHHLFWAPGLNHYKTVSGAEPHQLLCVTASCMASIVLPYNLRIWIRQAASQMNIEFTLDRHCPQS